jgi:hypothetical protein
MDEVQRRRQLLSDIELIADFLYRLIGEARELELPVGLEIRRMPARLARWRRDLDEIIP